MTKKRVLASSEVDDIILRDRSRKKDLRSILTNFFEEINKLEISLSEGEFDNIKYSSKELITVLNKLRIFSFSLEEVKRYITGEYDFYLYFQLYNLDLKETIKLVNYYVSIMGIDIKNLNVDKQIQEKLKFIISNRVMLGKILNCYNDYYFMEQTDFDIVVCSYSLEELKKLIESYMEYTNAYNKDVAFINDLNKKYYNLVFVRKLYERFFKKFKRNYDEDLKIVVFFI